MQEHTIVCSEQRSASAGHISRGELPCWHLSWRSHLAWPCLQPRLPAAVQVVCAGELSKTPPLAAGVPCSKCGQHLHHNLTRAGQYGSVVPPPLSLHGIQYDAVGMMLRAAQDVVWGLMSVDLVLGRTSFHLQRASAHWNKLDVGHGHAGQADAAPDEGHPDRGEGDEGAQRQVWRGQCAPCQGRRARPEIAQRLP